MTRRSLRIAILSQWYVPEPVTLPHDIAHELTSRGHQVRVLTAFPTYPDGEVAEGYRQQWDYEELIDGVRVRRVPTLPSHNRNALKRAANYMSFALMSTVQRRHLRNADVVYVYSTPLTAGTAALITNLSGSVPYVLHVQDVWPDSVTGSGMLPEGGLTKIASALLNRVARYFYRKAARVIAISPNMAELLVSRGSPASRTLSIYNWDTSPDSRPQLSSSNPQVGVTRFVYAGNVGVMQDLATLIRAVSLVEKTHDVMVDVVGDGTELETLKSLTAALGVSSIVFHGRVPRSEVDGYYARSHFSLVTLKRHAVFEVTIPSKFQGSLARGLPVVSTVQGAVADICNSEGCGITASPEDVAALADALRECATMDADRYAQMRARASDVHSRLFSRRSAMDSLEHELYAAAENTKQGEDR